MNSLSCLSTKPINVCCTFCVLNSLQSGKRLVFPTFTCGQPMPNHRTDAWRLDSKIPWFPKFVFFIFPSATGIERQSWSQLFQAKAASCKLSELVNWTSGNWSWIETSKHLGIRIGAFKLANKDWDLITVYILCFCQSHFIHVVNFISWD